MSRTNYVLIDFENLQPDLLGVLDHEDFRILVFVGANQARVPVEFAAVLQPLGRRAQYIRISGAGRNALDFHIALYIGELLARDSGGYFHIISSDNGFAPMIQHLRDRRVLARQYKAVADIPHVRALMAKTASERAAVVRDRLEERSAGWPASAQTLLSTIAGMFPSGLAEHECAAVVKALEEAGFVKLDDGKVKYPSRAAA